MSATQINNKDPEEEMQQYFSSFFSRFPSFSLAKVSQLAKTIKDSKEHIEYPNYSPPSVEDIDTPIDSANREVTSFTDSVQAVGHPIYHDERL